MRLIIDTAKHNLNLNIRGEVTTFAAGVGLTALEPRGGGIAR